ncbi:MAG: HAMP domain-containing sensor histidine kinase [Desulfuromonadales bacterium]
MPNHLAGKGFVIICDASDTIVQIIQNEYDCAHELSVGMPVMDMFDEACHEKVRLFFSEASSRGSAFDWELVVPLTAGIATVHCAAAPFDDKILLVGASTRDSAVELIEEMLRINNEQTNHLRLVMKELQHTSHQLKNKEQSIYEELTQLNNQLSVMQRELVKKNHELAELNKQKNYFLGMAAHDLRSPLGTIVSYCELLLDKEETGDDDRKLVGVISKSSEFMLGMINDLLDISTIESGNLNLGIIPLNLPDFIDRCVSNNQVIAEHKSVTISESLAGNLPDTVCWDANKIEQVLNNLLGNAIKFSHAGGSVRLGLERDNGNIVMKIEDNGKGLPLNLLDELFVPFSKASRLGTRGEKGTGLGLAICRRIVEGHGGDIRAENRPEGGTRFIVTMPIGGNDVHYA